jgi:hypothetical protein
VPDDETPEVPSNVDVGASVTPVHPRTWRQRLGQWVQLFVQGVHSRSGVWAVIGILLVVLVGATVGFLYWGWAPKFIPLYAADAEMLVVASAIYVIAVRWNTKDR